MEVTVADVVYTMVTCWKFSVLGWQLSIEFDDFAAYVEETEKNGQEDTNMSGTVLINDDGTFKWEEGGDELFVLYGSKTLADGIIEFLNTNGLPSGRNTRGE